MVARFNRQIDRPAIRQSRRIGTGLEDCVFSHLWVFPQRSSNLSGHTVNVFDLSNVNTDFRTANSHIGYKLWGGNRVIKVLRNEHQKGTGCCNKSNQKNLPISFTGFLRLEHCIQRGYFVCLF